MSLSKCTNGSKNTTHGACAGQAIEHGQNNVSLGFSSGPSGDFDDTVCLGTNARANRSGQLAIGSAHNPLVVSKHVGEEGDAQEVPKNPQLYLSIVLNGEEFLMPLYKPIVETQAIA